MMVAAVASSLHHRSCCRCLYCLDLLCSLGWLLVPLFLLGHLHHVEGASTREAPGPVENLRAATLREGAYLLPTEVALAWDPWPLGPNESDSLVYYQVQGRKSGTTSFVDIMEAPISYTVVLIQALDEETLYEFRVGALWGADADGLVDMPPEGGVKWSDVFSSYSGGVSLTSTTETEELTIELVPTGLSAPKRDASGRPSKTSVSLVWDAPSYSEFEVEAYELQHDGGFGDGFSSSTTLEASYQSFQINGLHAGSTVRVRLRAKSKVGWSDWSPEATFLACGTPTAPLDLQVVHSDAAWPILSWSPPTGTGGDESPLSPAWEVEIDHYEVFMKVSASDSTPYSFAIVPGNTTTSYLATPFLREPELELTVVASNGVFEGPVSVSVSVLNTAKPKQPGPPELLDAGSNYMNITWEEPEHGGYLDPLVENYELNWDLGRGGSVGTQVYVGPDNFTSVEGIPSSKNVFRFKVRGVNENGPGPWSTVSRLARQPPATPSTPSTSLRERGSVELQWVGSSNWPSVIYEMEYTDLDTGVASVKKSRLTSMTIASLHPLHRYRFRVRSCDDSSVTSPLCSDYSASAITSASGRPEAPEPPERVSYEDGKITITWSALSSEVTRMLTDSYLIKVSTSIDGTFAIAGRVSASASPVFSYACDTTLLPYFAKLRAAYSNSNSSDNDSDNDSNSTSSSWAEPIRMLYFKVASLDTSVSSTEGAESLPSGMLCEATPAAPAAPLVWAKRSQNTTFAAYVQLSLSGISLKIFTGWRLKLSRIDWGEDESIEVFQETPVPTTYVFYDLPEAALWEVSYAVTSLAGNGTFSDVTAFRTIRNPMKPTDLHVQWSSESAVSLAWRWSEGDRLGDYISAWHIFLRPSDDVQLFDARAEDYYFDVTSPSLVLDGASDMQTVLDCSATSSWTASDMSGKAFWARVAAVGAYGGLGDLSSALRATCAAPPSRPPMPTFHDAGDGYVRLRWEAPDLHGGQLRAVRVHIVPALPKGEEDYISFTYDGQSCIGRVQHLPRTPEDSAPFYVSNTKLPTSSPFPGHGSSAWVLSLANVPEECSFYDSGPVRLQIDFLARELLVPGRPLPGLSFKLLNSTLSGVFAGPREQWFPAPVPKYLNISGIATSQLNRFAVQVITDIGESDLSKWLGEPSEDLEVTGSTVYLDRMRGLTAALPPLPPVLFAESSTDSQVRIGWYLDPSLERGLSTWRYQAYISVDGSTWDAGPYFVYTGDACETPPIGARTYAMPCMRTDGEMYVYQQDCTDPGLNSNYLGHSVIERENADDQSDMQFLDTGAAFPRAGEITAVTFFLARQNPQSAEFDFRIYRPQGDGTYRLVDRTPLIESPGKPVLSEGIQTYELAAPIEVEAGDYVGWGHLGQSTIGYDLEGDTVLWVETSSGTAGATIGDIFSFTHSQARTYSYLVRYIPRDEGSSPVTYGTESRSQQLLWFKVAALSKMGGDSEPVRGPLSDAIAWRCSAKPGAPTSLEDGLTLYSTAYAMDEYLVELPSVSEVSKGNLTLTWASPAYSDLHGAVLLGYKVYADDGNSGREASGTSLSVADRDEFYDEVATIINPDITSYVFGPVDVGSTYRFRVAAVTDVGEGSNATIVLHAATAPRPPTNLAAVLPFTSGSVTMSWAWDWTPEIKGTGGMALSGWKLYISEDGASWPTDATLDLDPTWREVTITCNVGALLFVRLVTETSLGLSEPSEAISLRCSPPPATPPAPLRVGGTETTIELAVDVGSLYGATLLGFEVIYAQATSFNNSENDCPWSIAHTEDDILQCLDGSLCNTTNSSEGSWGCCAEHGGRAKCPANYPTMCAGALPSWQCFGDSYPMAPESVTTVAWPPGDEHESFEDFCCQADSSNCLTRGEQRQCPGWGTDFSVYLAVTASTARRVVISDLLPGWPYAFRVKVHSDAGNSSNSEWQSVALSGDAPPAPTALESGGSDGSTVVAKWEGSTESGGAALRGYLLYFSTNRMRWPDKFTWTAQLDWSGTNPAGPTAELSFEHNCSGTPSYSFSYDDSTGQLLVETSLEDRSGADVYVRVAAYSGSAESLDGVGFLIGEMSEVLALPCQQLPDAPTVEEMASSSATSIMLRWLTPMLYGATLDGYNIYLDDGLGGELVLYQTITAAEVAVDSSAARRLADAWESSPQYYIMATLSGLTSHRVYRYKVTTVTTSGESSLSTPTGTVACRPPRAPTVLRSVDPSNLTIQWTSSSSSGGSCDAAYYEVVVALEDVQNGTEEFSGTFVTDDGAASSLTVEGLQEGSSYRFFVRAHLAAGYKDSPSLVTVAAGVPSQMDTPTQDGSSAQAGTIWLIWSPPDFNGGEAIGYEVFRDNADGYIRSEPEEHCIAMFHNVSLCEDAAVAMGNETEYDDVCKAKSLSASPLATGCALAGLESGAYYFVQVRAISTFGRGPLSETVRLPAAGVPVTTAPSQVAGSAENCTMVWQWEAANGKGLPVEKYFIKLDEYSSCDDADSGQGVELELPDEMISWVAEPDNKEPYWLLQATVDTNFLGALAEGVSYRAAIGASNGVGTSSWSPWSCSVHTSASSGFGRGYCLDEPSQPSAPRRESEAWATQGELRVVWDVVDDANLTGGDDPWEMQVFYDLWARPATPHWDWFRPSISPGVWRRQAQFATHIQSTTGPVAANAALATVPTWLETPSGTPWAFKLRLRNRNGIYGPFSDEVVLYSGTLPSAPLDLRVNYEDTGHPILSWTAPSSVGIPTLTSYEAHCDDEEATAEWQRDTLATGTLSLTLDRVLPVGNVTECQVRAVNAVGLGPTASISFTPSP